MKKTILIVGILGICAFIMSGCGGSGSSAGLNVKGTWTGTIHYSQPVAFDYPATYNITNQTGTTFNGTATVSSSTNIPLSGNVNASGSDFNYSFSYSPYGTSITVTGHGAVSGNKVTGTWSATGGYSGTFDLTKQP